MASLNKDIDLLLIGKTGNGKSSTGNSILNRKIFKSGADTTSITKQVQANYGDYNGLTIKVVDGPGIGDTDLTEQEAFTEIVNTMSLAIATSPRGYHAVLLVVKYGERFTKEDKQTIKVLKAVFGEEFVKKFCVLVVSCGDNFRYNKNESDSFENWCSFQTGGFRDLIVECRHRIVLFDNRTEDADVKSKQLDRLLEIVDRLGSSGERYTNKHFELAQEKRDTLLVDLRKPIICEESMKEASLILQGLGKIHLDEPDAQLKHLDILLERAENLLESITKQDNNTGVLQELILSAKQIKETVEGQMSSARNALDIQNKRREMHEEMEKLRQEKAKHQHEPDDLERRKFQERIQKLEEEDRRNRERIERMEAEMRRGLGEVEGKYAEASGNSMRKTIEEISAFLIKNLLPVVLEFLAAKVLKK